MKIIALTPTRGDRGLFLEHLDYMLARQSVQVDEHIVIDDFNDSPEQDVSWRYLIGLDRAKSRGADIILAIEDDDWYHEDYVKHMLLGWKKSGRPQVFGINTSIYYHLFGRKYTYMMHLGRASMMATLLRGDVTIPSFAEKTAFLDLFIWRGLELARYNRVAVGFDRLLMLKNKKDNIKKVLPFSWDET